MLYKEAYEVNSTLSHIGVTPLDSVGLDWHNQEKNVVHNTLSAGLRTMAVIKLPVFG